MPPSRFWLRSLTVFPLIVASACSRPAPAPVPVAGSNDAAFKKLAVEVLEDTYRRAPTQATYLGIHTYDDKLEDYSRQGVVDQVAAARQFKSQADAIDPATLSLEAQPFTTALRGMGQRA